MNLNLNEKKFDKMQEYRSLTVSLQEDMNTHISNCLDIYSEMEGKELDIWYYPDGLSVEVPLDFPFKTCITSDGIKNMLLTMVVWFKKITEPTYSESIYFDFPGDWLFKSLDEVKQIIIDNKSKSKKKK